MNEDEKAKERARLQPRSAGSSRQIPEDAASKLDELIAEKRRDYNGAADREAKNKGRRGSDSSGGVHREPPSGFRDLSRMEADAAAKSRARPTAKQTARIGAYQIGTSSPRDELTQMESDIAAKTRSMPAAASPSASTPGAYVSTPSGRTDLAELESDVIAKSRARPALALAAPHAYSSDSGRANLNHLESDVIAKSRARPASATPTPGAYSSTDIRSEIAHLEAEATGRPRRNMSGASPADLNQLEADVAAKARGRNPGQTGTNREPTARTELTQLESDVAAKSMARPIRQVSTPGARQELRSLEDSVVQKGQSASQGRARTELTQLEADIVTKEAERSVTPTTSSRPGVTNVAELDERIAYKTGIPLDREEKEENPEDDDIRSRLENRVSKLTGIPREAVGAAIEKFDSRQEGSPLSALEQKLEGLPYQGTTTGRGYLDDVETGDDEGDRLAVAVAIKEEEDDAFIPAAVEYDPDAKPPIYKNRRFRLYGLLACTLLVVVVGGVVGLLSQKDKTVYDEEPSAAPTSARYNLGIQEQLELVVGSEKLNDPDSSHYRALKWIINEDAMQVGPEDSNLIQRYLLAVFYFKTHEQEEWLSCNAATETELDDFCLYQKLTRVFPSEYRGIPWYRWLSNNHECMWAGIFCDEFDQIRSLDLTGQQISNTLPVELSYFPFLHSIGLSWNNFYGSIPAEYAEMNHLLSLELHYNALTGTLPNDWSNAKNIQLFNIAANEITGTLPPDIKSLTKLKGIFLFENFLTGTFPTEFAAMELLTFVRIQRNFLSGTLPTEIGNLSHAREFWVHRMPLTGSIPSEIGNMRETLDIRMHSTAITGTIPDELWNLSDLWRLDLYGMRLTGTLSSNMSKMTNVHILRVNDNELTGTVPTEIGLLTKLEKVWFEGNNFRGEIPSTLCALRGAQGLQEVVADCLSSAATGFPAVTCDCCDLCCDSESGECDA